MVLWTIWVGAIVGAKKVEAFRAAAINLKVPDHLRDMSFPYIKSIFVFDFYDDKGSNGAVLRFYNYVGIELASEKFDALFWPKEIRQSGIEALPTIGSEIGLRDIGSVWALESTSNAPRWCVASVENKHFNSEDGRIFFRGIWPKRYTAEIYESTISGSLDSISNAHNLGLLPHDNVLAVRDFGLLVRYDVLSTGDIIGGAGEIMLGLGHTEDSDCRPSDNASCDNVDYAKQDVEIRQPIPRPKTGLALIVAVYLIGHGVYLIVYGTWITQYLPF